ncbi:MAG: fluoride efflux transporter CrcB [Variovorax sp.]|nr:MAG: fluoride efflux transporter CrcB [Variovorax sp.]
MLLLPVIAISLGAAFGALSRWGLALWLGTGGLMPWGTLAANLIGGYLIGIMVAAFALMPDIDPVWRLAIVTGFLGGLTTFSSFSAEVVTMLLEGRLGVAALTALSHLAGSLFLTWLGIRTVQAVAA